MPHPSTCPECGELLDHTVSGMPGDPEGSVTATCPECGFSEKYEKDPF